jgi:hypothetical protein
MNTKPYLTFLNVHQLERQGVDIQTKIEEVEELNQCEVEELSVKPNVGYNNTRNRSKI